MPKPTQVQLSFIQIYIRQILQFGCENEWHTKRDTYKIATICTKIIRWVLRLRQDPIIDTILKNEGGTLESLVDRLKIDYATRKGYIRKRVR